VKTRASSEGESELYTLSEAEERRRQTLETKARVRSAYCQKLSRLQQALQAIEGLGRVERVWRKSESPRRLKALNVVDRMLRRQQEAVETVEGSREVRVGMEPQSPGVLQIV